MFEKEQKKNPGQSFHSALKNFSFAMQRFNSLSGPLMKIIALLPIVFKFLANLTSKGDTEDKAWARGLLAAMTGPTSYDKLVTAAMVADAMLIGNVFLRQDDAADSNAFIKASEARGPWLTEFM